MEKTALDKLRKDWSAPTRSVAQEVTFAGLKNLKPFQFGKELTNSARSTFLQCPQKYQYSYVYGLAPQRPSIPFLVGGLFHDELERLYTTEKLNYKAMRERVGEACEKAAKQVRGEDSDRIWMQQAIVCGMVKGYAAMYLEKDLKKWEVVEAEGSFKAALPNGWTYRGKKDLVIRSRKTRRLSLMEHKTAGRLDAGYVAKLPLDNQILGYAWSQQESGGEEFESVVYNITKKPQIKQRGNESLRDFFLRVEEDYLRNPVAYFYRETLSFTGRDLERFRNELKRFVRNVERAQAENDFYQNAGHCTAMGICPFMKLCLDGVNKDTLLYYRVKARAHEELPEAQED